jgi:hypothetical protein
MFLKWLVSIFQIRVGLFGSDHPVTLPTIPPLTLPAFVKARQGGVLSCHFAVFRPMKQK